MAFEYLDGIELSIERFEGLSQIFLNPAAMMELWKISRLRIHRTLANIDPEKIRCLLEARVLCVDEEGNYRCVESQEFKTFHSMLDVFAYTLTHKKHYEARKLVVNRLLTISAQTHIPLNVIMGHLYSFCRYHEWHKHCPPRLVKILREENAVINFFKEFVGLLPAHLLHDSPGLPEVTKENYVKLGKSLGSIVDLLQL